MPVHQQLVGGLMMRTREKITAPIAVLSLILAAGPVQAQSSDALVYQLGGAAPFSISAGRGHRPSELGLGVRWNADARCGNFNIGATVSNQLNGMTNGFQNLMGDVVQNAKGAVASLPAMIIQRANPQLYDLLSNGVLQGRVDYDKTTLSCQSMAEQMADMAMGEGMQQQAMAESWQDAAGETRDAVAAQEVVDANGGNGGTTWVGGEPRGGVDQPPLNVVEDAAQAGYNILQGRSDPTSDAAVPGGGGGWETVAQGDTGSAAIWSTPSDAVEWVRSVLGDSELRSCDGCEKRRDLAGTGLVPELEEEQAVILEDLEALVSGSTRPTQANLAAASAGNGLTITRGVVEALRDDPQRDLLLGRLAGEIAMARTLTKAIWARRMLLAGSAEPGIAGNDQAREPLDRKLETLNRDIEALQSEMEIRQALADNAASTTLRRASARARGDSLGASQRASVLDDRGRPAGGGAQ